MKSLPLAVTLGLFTLSLSAQIQNARVEGNVVDSSRAVIVGAKLVITNNKTQVKTEAETDAAGFFTFPVVPPGFYSLSAEAKGFRKGEITNVEVNVGVTLREDVVLEVGSTGDVVTVEANS